MNILFLSSGSRVPSARFRILPYLRLFKAEGHRCVLANSFPQKYDYFPWMGFRPSQLLKRSTRWWHWLRAKLSSFDVVFIDREIFDNDSIHMEQRFRDCCGKLVIDIDDAVFLRHPAKFDVLLKMADLVVCGNRFLMEKAEPLNSQLLHVPTCVDMDDYTARQQSGSRHTPIVGWMGTTGNLKYIEVAAEALRRVANDTDFELRIVVPEIAPLQQTDLAGVNVVHEKWDPVNEVVQLKQMDVGLMPLFPNQEWDIYKCGLKLIQYLAVEVPGIAAPVGVNSEIIDGNQNGFVAQSTDEWEDRATNPSKRRDSARTDGKTRASDCAGTIFYPSELPRAAKRSAKIGGPIVLSKYGQYAARPTSVLRMWLTPATLVVAQEAPAQKFLRTLREARHPC